MLRSLRPSTSRHALFALSESKNRTEEKREYTQTNQLEQNINLFWSGSLLRPKHIERIKEWKKLNKDKGYTVTVWVDACHESEIKDQLKDKEIQVKTKDTLKLSDNLLGLVKKLTEAREDKLLPNYAAASDVYRFIILQALGGWYVDTDITPIDLSNIKINSNLNFYINASRKENDITHLSPSVIASSTNNVLSAKAIEFLEKLAIKANEDLIKGIRSNTASIRMISTFVSTGFALRGALGKIKVNDISILETLNENDNKTFNTDIFDSIATFFQNNLEQSWILQNVVHHQGQTTVFPLSGITLDEDYINSMSGHKAKFYSSETYESFAELRDEIHSRLADISLSIDTPKATDLKYGAVRLAAA